MSSNQDRSQIEQPRAIVHKSILNVAEDEPDASIDDIASAVTGASPNLVERVLDKYGDPVAPADEQSATDQPDPMLDDASSSTMNSQHSTDEEVSELADGSSATEPVPAGSMPESGGSDSTPDSEGSESVSESSTATESDATDASTMADDSVVAEPLDDLTEKQRGLLETIWERPDATQQDLAAEFDVSQATVSNHLNAIDGFDWRQRETFVETMLDDDYSDAPADNQSEHDEDEIASLAAALQELTETVDSLEERIDVVEKECTTSTELPFDNPELVSKILHACLNDENITYEEEIKVLEHFVAGDIGAGLSTSS